jgi:hypothetical protein
MERKGFIGGSDAVKIMNGEWYELWEIKTGRSPSADLSDNIAVQLGIHTEDFNLNWFEKQHKCVLSDHQLELVNNDSLPLKGTIDAKWGNAIVEAKHTNAFSNIDDIIQRYMPQIQLYCHIAQAKGAHLSVIFGNSKWESVYVEYSASYTSSMMAVLADFWRHVTEDIEPIGVDVPNIDIASIPVDQMIVRDATKDNAFVDAAVTYINLQQQNVIFENAKKDLKNMVADNEREVFCDYVTVKRDKRGSLRITRRA